MKAMGLIGLNRFIDRTMLGSHPVHLFNLSDIHTAFIENYNNFYFNGRCKFAIAYAIHTVHHRQIKIELPNI
jgi:hypothetical protein